MTADTLVLDASTDTYQLVADRCAVELVVRVLRLPLVWVRLRVISAALDLGDPGRLRAELASTPRYGSLPFAQRWAMRSIPRRARIRVDAELPPLSPGATVHTSATATTGTHTWSVPLDVRLAARDEHGVVLAVRGHIARPPGVLVQGAHLFVDAAAEFRP